MINYHKCCRSAYFNVESNLLGAIYLPELEFINPSDVSWA